MLSNFDFTPLEPAVTLKQPEVGKLIRELRQLMGQTQEKFATVLGVSFSTLNRWERGHVQPSPLAFKQVYAVLIQLSQSPVTELQDGSKVLLEKYFSKREKG